MPVTNFQNKNLQFSEMVCNIPTVLNCDLQRQCLIHTDAFVLRRLSCTLKSCHVLFFTSHTTTSTSAPFLHFHILYFMSLRYSISMSESLLHEFYNFSVISSTECQQSLADLINMLLTSSDWSVKA